jgi:hypothetical protein
MQKYKKIKNKKILKEGSPAVCLLFTPPPTLKIDISRLFVAISYFVGTFLLLLYIDSKI